MKQMILALAAIGLCVSGCGPAGQDDESGLETGAIEQKLTPCLSECYSGCTASGQPVTACRAGCREACAGS